MSRAIRFEALGGSQNSIHQPEELEVLEEYNPSHASSVTPSEKSGISGRLYHGEENDGPPANEGTSPILLRNISSENPARFSNTDSNNDAIGPLAVDLGGDGAVASMNMS